MKVFRGKYFFGFYILKDSPEFFSEVCENVLGKLEKENPPELAQVVFGAQKSKRYSYKTKTQRKKT